MTIKKSTNKNSVILSQPPCAAPKDQFCSSRREIAYLKMPVILSEVPRSGTQSKDLPSPCTSFPPAHDPGFLKASPTPSIPIHVLHVTPV
jgi:hypothetical protein